MSKEQVLKTLANLGFDEVDSQIYVYLAKKGMTKASDICKALKLTKQQFYPSIKQLQNKGIVSSTIEHPARFSVMSFENVLDLFIKEKMEEAQRLQKSKEAILSNWQNLKLEDDTTGKFTVIQGRTFIYTKFQQMITAARNQTLAITTVPVLAQANERDIFDAGYNNPSKSKVQFRYIVELCEQNAHIMKSLMDETKDAQLNFKGRNPDLGLTLFPQMLVRDEEEALFFVKPRTDMSIIDKDDTCLWTDCKTLVRAFVAVFEDLWHNSTDIAEKLSEIETGRLTPKTTIISDAEIAKKKYYQIMKTAKEEILAITSSEALVDLDIALSNLDDLTEKRVSIKIMAPIVGENLEAANHLSSFCSVKHVPPNYLQTTIVDGKYLFQFATSNSRNLPTDSLLQFENTLFTTNPEYVTKTKTMLYEIWRNSNSPSSDNLKSLFGTGIRSQSAYFPGAIRSPGPDGTFHPVPPADPTKKNHYPAIAVVDEDPSRKLTEQDVLKEIIDAQKSPLKNEPGPFKIYSTQAIAVIHPPDLFKLPPMLIRVHHIEKHSTFGEEDAVIINLWLETQSGPAYVPVAVFSDNPNAQSVWGRHFEATPAGQNIHLARKGTLQIWVHGNTLFAGWTVPIPLFPSDYVLPPACILIEGYGNVKTEAYSVVQPSGGKFKAMQNGFDAFVTFMHSSSKYSGPGTDGFLVRDFVMEITPQFIEGFHPKLETRLVEKGKRV